MSQMEHVGNDIWHKTCARCKHVYIVEAKTWAIAYNGFRESFSDAWKMSKAFDHLDGRCKECMNDRHTKGIRRDKKLADQNNECGICCEPISFKDKTANIDHCHKSGKVRKVICRRCNNWMAPIDNDEWLLKAIAYRDSYRDQKDE